MRTGRRCWTCAHGRRAGASSARGGCPSDPSPGASPATRSCLPRSSGLPCSVSVPCADGDSGGVAGACAARMTLRASLMPAPSAARRGSRRRDRPHGGRDGRRHGGAVGWLNRVRVVGARRACRGHRRPWLPHRDRGVTHRGTQRSTRLSPAPRGRLEGSAVAPGVPNGVQSVAARSGLVRRWRRGAGVGRVLFAPGPVRPSRRRAKGRCTGCGYDRAGLAEGAACPECGGLDTAAAPSVGRLRA